MSALRYADEVVLAPVFRMTVPEQRRLSPERVVAELNAAGTHARYAPTTGAIVDIVSGEAQAGDLVVVMSNGAFDAVHEKLLAALAQQTRPA